MNVTQFLDFLGVTELWTNIKAYILGRVVDITQDEYDALGDEKLTNGVVYCITDGSSGSTEITIKNSTLVVSSSDDGTIVVDKTLYFDI